jgi:uncharacterized membrane protein YfcA
MASSTPTTARVRPPLVGPTGSGASSAGVVARIVLIGCTGGLFSGLLGVGGGVVMVPLLILVLDYEPSLATGTSLVAIVLIATAGTVAHVGYGNVRYVDGLLIGIPALAGVLFGTWVQQKLSGYSLTIAFCAVLTAMALWLLIR